MRPTSWLAMLAVISACEPKPPPAAHPQTNTDAAPAPAAPAASAIHHVIDAHTHIHPMAYGPYLQLTSDVEVYRAVNMSGGSSLQMREQNLALADETPGRIALFHNINWEGIDNDDFGTREAAALEQSVRSGFAGLKISKALGLGVRTEDGKLVSVDDPRLDPIWAKAGELGIPVAIHTSDPKAFFEPPTPDNERYAELSYAPSWSFYGDEFPSRKELLDARDPQVARHPETTFILLHFANNPEDPDYVAGLLQKYPNVLLDVAARVGEIGRHDAAKIRKIFEQNQDRILFATDMQMGVRRGPDGRPVLRLTLGSVSEKPPRPRDIVPFYRQHFAYFEGTGAPIEHPVPIQGDWKVNPLGLGKGVLDKLYWANAERIVMAPWLGRRAAFEAATTARRLAQR